MPEQSSIEQGGEIQLPSALRIRQRLGHVSTSRAFKRDVVAPLQLLGGKTLQTDELLTELDNRLSTYATLNCMNQPAVVLNNLPRIVNQLVDNELQQNAVIYRWLDGMVEEVSFPISGRPLE